MNNEVKMLNLKTLYIKFDMIYERGSLTLIGYVTMHLA